jgi:hypothetical protein
MSAHGARDHAELWNLAGIHASASLLAHLVEAVWDLTDLIDERIPDLGSLPPKPKPPRKLADGPPS